MPRDTDHTDQATAELLAELRELCSDVTGDAIVRSRRLAVLRRLERRTRDNGRDRTLAVA